MSRVSSHMIGSSAFLAYGRSGRVTALQVVDACIDLLKVAETCSGCSKWAVIVGEFGW